MGADIVSCEEHGLRYDRATQSGCVVCRREQGATSEAPASGALGPKLLKIGAVIVAVAIGLAVSRHVMWFANGQGREVNAYLSAVREARAGEEERVFHRFEGLMSRISLSIQNDRPLPSGAQADYRRAEADIAALRARYRTVPRPVSVERHVELTEAMFGRIDETLRILRQIVDGWDRIVADASGGTARRMLPRLRALSGQASRADAAAGRLCDELEEEEDRLIRAHWLWLGRADLDCEP